MIKTEKSVIPSNDNMGLKTAIRTANLVVKKVPAYGDFLKKKLGKKNITITEKNFHTLPLIDKPSYLYKYSLNKLIVSGKLPPMMHTSSGSSGQPTYWFRTDQQENGGSSQVEHVFKNNFDIRPRDKILIVNCFSMGTWVAGTYMLEVGRILARRSFNVSTVCPGIEQEDVVNILKYLPRTFSKIIILGYPPFLTNIFQTIKTRGIKITGDKLRIITSGGNFSEEWRKQTMKVNGIKKSKYICSFYGSADVGIMATETPLSVWLRENLEQNSELKKSLGINGKELPSLFQYDPPLIYFEEQKSELLLTTDGGIPLVRYGIKDTGRVFSFVELLDLLKKCGLYAKVASLITKQTQRPLLILIGRSDVMILFYAINIFPSYIHNGLKTNNLINLASGAYVA
ncbi:MAG: hypothetical protein HY481_00465, partial [Candidatus Vogelbacteria bacterium]|nr:hypothetical protein [Candidatus Vogelbacteria bacterium]